MGLSGGERVQFVGSRSGEAGKTSCFTSAKGREMEELRTSGWKRRVDRYCREYGRGAGERETKCQRNDWYSRGS